jgi:hypothetical protein
LKQGQISVLYKWDPGKETDRNENLMRIVSYLELLQRAHSPQVQNSVTATNISKQP